MSSSTPTSRLVRVSTREAIDSIPVKGDPTPYALPERMTLEPGNYRAELDPKTHTATIALIAVAPEEGKP